MPGFRQLFYQACSDGAARFLQDRGNGFLVASRDFAFRQILQDFAVCDWNHRCKWRCYRDKPAEIGDPK